MSTPEIEEKQAMTLDDAIEHFKHEAESKSNFPVLFDLGSGKNPREGFVGLDNNPYKDNERVEFCDLSVEPWLVKGWPIPSNSVDLACSSHFLEHVSDWDLFFRELYRVMKPDGACIFITPYYTHVAAMQDPTHKQFISEARYAYLSKKWRDQWNIDYLSDVNFNFAFEPWFDYSPDISVLSDPAKEFARLHYFNAVFQMVAFLRVIK